MSDDTYGPAQSVPEIPPLRTFRIVKNFGVSDADSQIEVRAHEVEVGANAVRFREFLFDAHYGPTSRIVKCLMKPQDGWIEYSEILPSSLVF